MNERGYQYDFSHENAAMHSVEGRQRKAATMIAVLEQALGKRLAESRLLNVGCSTGIIDTFLAAYVGKVVGIDIDEPAVSSARERCRASNAEFRVGDAMQLDFPDGSFDIVICAQVYEHVPDPKRMMEEIHRVLAPGGVCYFAATNRFCIMEQHYHLPLLSAIPVPLAHWYLRLARRGKYYHERHLSLHGLRDLARRFAVEDFTRRILAEPARFQASYLFGGGAKLAVARAVAQVAYWAFPGYIWLLWRNPQSGTVSSISPMSESGDA